MVDVYAPPAHRPLAAEMRSNVWWFVAAAGIALVALARIVAFMDQQDNDADEVFYLIGWLAVVAGMTLAALFGSALHWGGRVALLIAAALLAFSFGRPFA